MTAEWLIHELIECGVQPELTPDKLHISVLAGLLTDAQRQAILANKSALVVQLAEIEIATAELLAAAMNACDHWLDGEEAREQMRLEVLATPYRLRAEILHALLEHLRRKVPLMNLDDRQKTLARLLPGESASLS